MTADERPTTNDNLPDGWVWATLGEACEVNPTMSWPESFTKETPVSFVPMAAVDDVTGAIVAAESRPIDEVWRGYKRFAEGDVIFARITPCMENGKAAIATGLVNGIGLGSTEFHVLRPKGAVSAEWVYHFVRQQSFRNGAAREMTGTAGQLRVPKSFMEEAPIPLPPEAEQRRIVAKIEALFRQARRGREALDAVPDLLDQFRQAVLAAAFCGELTERDPADEPASVLLERIRTERRRRWEGDLRAKGKDPSRYTYKEPAPLDTSDLPELPEGWVWTTLPEVGELARGKSKHRPRNDEKLFGGVYPFIQTGDVRQADGVITTYTQTYNEFGLAQSRLWPKGTLCITIAANIADTAILGFDACFPDSVVGFIGEEDACNVRFIEYFIRTAKNDLEQFAPATAQKNINLRTLQQLAIPLAPLEEQHRIANRIEALFAQADLLEAQVAAVCRRLEQVDQAVLARAFRGELVPQDPDDEPASVLLERIRKGREAHSAKRKTQQMRFPTT